MEKYLLCGELSVSSKGEEDGASTGNGIGGVRVYKGRRRGTVDFCGIWRHSKAMKDLVANGVGIALSQDEQVLPSPPNL